MKSQIITLAIIFIGITVFGQNINDYQYDNLNRLTRVSYPNGTVYQYSYDQLGNRVLKEIQASSASQPDLSVLSPALDANTIAAGAQIGSSGSIANTGSGSASSFYVKYYLSTDQNYQPGIDTEIGSYYCISLSSGTNVQVSSNLLIPLGTAPGAYYVLFFADGTEALSETDELNNIEPVQLNVISCTVMQIDLSIADATCGMNNGVVSSVVSGGTAPYTYFWSNGGTNSSIANLSGGSYLLNVTDVNGCINNANATVNIIDPPVIDLISTDATCGNSDGSVTAYVSGGTAPYLFTWNTGATTSTVNNLPAGTYSVTISDASNCIVSDNVSVSTPANIQVTLYSIDPTCGNTDGTIYASVTGGTAPYNYAWSSGQSTQSISNLGQGTYSLTVIDSLNCSYITGITLTQVNNMVVSISSTNTTCGINNGIANAIVSNGTAPYSYLWENGQTSQQAINLAVGTYNVTVSDSNGCSTVSYATVNSTLPPSVYISTTPTACIGNTGSATAVVSNGTPPYSYLWSTGDTTPTIINLPVGAYSVTATDAGGCQDEQSASIVFQNQASIMIPSDSLIAYYPFDGNAFDLSGNGYHGTLYGSASFTPGVINDCVHLVGSGYTGASGGHVLLPSIDFNSLEHFTISIWVYEQGMTSTDGESYINYGTVNGNVMISHFSNLIHFSVSDTSITVPFESSYLNNWVFYSLVYNEGSFQGYINGTLVGSKTRNVNVTTSDAAIGRHWWWTTSTRLIGNIDNVRIYSKSLNNAEIQALYNESSSTPNIYSGLVASYPFNGNADDVSGNNLNGTVHNNVTLTTDRNGNPNSAYYFGGTINDWIEIPHNSLLNIGPDFTVSAWIYKESGSNNYVLGKGRDITCGTWLLGTPSISVDGSCGTSASNPTVLNNNQWYMITGVLNSSTGTLRYYQDGQLITEVSSNSFTGNNTYPFAIGRHLTVNPPSYTEPYSFPFKGKIDDVRIYNRVLNDAEISILYQGESVSNITVSLGNDTTICENSQLTLNAGNGFSSYLWSTGEYTQSIQPENLNPGLHEFIVQVSACGDIIADSVFVIVNPLPGSASIISGDTTVCAGQGAVLYTTPNISNTDVYEWVLPTGATGTSATNSITVNYSTLAVSGDISVYGSNSCGSGSGSILPVTINTIPDSAGIISGADSVCAGLNGLDYFIPAIANAVTYEWNLSSGLSGASTTNNITIGYDSITTTGIISVRGVNSCGAGLSSELLINILHSPDVADSILGLSSVCQGQNSVNYFVPPIANASSYLWSLPNGTSGSSTINNINVDFSSLAQSGNIVVKGVNSCGFGSEAWKTIYVNPLPANADYITGLTNVCQGQENATYCVPPVANSSYYIWTLPNGVSGSGSTNCISVNYSDSAMTGSIVVNGANYCGNGGQSVLPVTVNPLPDVNISNLDSFYCVYNPSIIISGTPYGGVFIGQGINNSTFSPNSAGIGYWPIIYTYTDGYYCTNTDTVFVLVDACTGIEDDDSIEINVFPNPFNETFEIIADGIASTIYIGITDAIGRCIYTGSFEKRTRVDLGRVSPGLYSIELRYENTIKTMKVIKN